MKQIIQSYKTGEIKLEKVPRPQVAPGMLLLETKASIVSAGTEKMLVDLAKKSLFGKAHARPDLVKKVFDAARKEGMASALQKVRSKLDNPMPLGYSCAGVVTEVGRGVDEFQVDDLVACGGAGYANHAEFNVVPKNLCVRIPATKEGLLSSNESAFATVGAIALQGVRQAGLTLGENVAIIGLGLMGQIAVQLCVVNGCRVIGADIDNRKIEIAMQFGAEAAVQSKNVEQAVYEHTSGIGADAVLIMAGTNDNRLVKLASGISRQKGRVVVVGFVGMDLPREEFYKKELDLRMSMSYGPGRYDPEYEERGHDYPLPYVRWTEQRNMQTILELCAAGRLNLKPLITHRFPFESALDAYELITSGKEPYLGILLEYSPKKQEGVITISTGSKTTASNRIRLGLIGAGNFAKGVLLPKIAKLPDIGLVGIATGRGMSSKAVGEQFGFQYCAESGDNIIADDSINTVLIATKHNTHADFVTKAIKAGKHVFVEKPLCITVQQLDEIAELFAQGSRLKAQGNEKTDNQSQDTKSIHKQKNKLFNESTNQPMLMVGYNRRFSPFIRKASEVLVECSGPMFACYNVNAGFIPKDSWVQDPNEGGGRIIGEVCHFVDTLRFLCGSKVRSVQAACIQTDDHTQMNRDSVAVTLKYANGSIGVINYHALGSSDYSKERIEVSAGRTTLVIDDFRRMQIFDSKKEKLKSAQDKGFDAEIEAFIQSITTGNGFPIPLAELIESSLVTFAIHEALSTGHLIFLDQYAEKLGLPKFQ